MKRNLCLIGLAATLVLGLVPAAVHAETITYSFRGSAAAARFETTEGCISTETDIFVYEHQSHFPPGPAPEGSPGIEIFIYRYNICGEISFLSSVSSRADLPEGAFSVSGGLQGATLNAAIEVEDETGNRFPISIDIAWSGVGEVSRSINHENASSPGVRGIWRSKGTSRDATATGSVVLETANVTLNPSINGTLMDAQSGIVIIESF
ncbi:MAG: hypothetical protein ACJ76J_04535 [Thermoanaerobaculia bacterium]